MKTTCPICNERNAKRRCWRKNMEEICPLCCAGMRGTECGNCPHYGEAQKYDSARRASAAPSGKDFIIELNPKAEEAVNAALELAERGDVRRAGDALARLLQEYPRDHMARYGMGTLHAIKGEHQEAIRYFDQAIAIFPYFTEAHYNRAAACQKQLDIAGAIRGFRKVVEIGDSNDTPAKQARSNLGKIAAIIRQTEGVDFEIYIESQEAFDRAFALMEQGDWWRALAGFRASAAKHDRNAPTHGNLGLCLAKLGRKAEALAELDRALEINPRYEPAVLNRVAVERMEEGQPLQTAEFMTINYSREKVLRERGR
ncbi:MAG: tetratricopeptide repeat protein [Opitutaceae bacterium]|nr:tetratricopeptide repeat protein [Opitutaceae bacterium]